MSGDRIDDAREHVTELACADGAVEMLPAGSVLILTQGAALAHSLPVAVATRPLTASREIRAFICGPRLRPDFLQAVLASQDRSLLSQAISFSHGSKALPDEAVRNLPVPCPPLSDQEAIGVRLRQRIDDIDSLITAKNSALPYIVENQQSVIFTAATRGIKKQVAMRPSSLPWLSEIPAHWDIRKMSHLGKIRMGATPPRNQPGYWTDGTVPWVTSTVVHQRTVTSSREFVTEDAVRDCHLPELRPGTVLVATSGAGRTRGLATILSIEATINQNLIAIEPNRALVDSWYLRWILGAAYTYLRGISDHSGSIAGALKTTDIADLRLPLPPIREQHAISDYISQEYARLATLASTTQDTVDLLKELRGTLLATAVVGQK
jgi:type I restriction enzyme S subunit